MTFVDLPLSQRIEAAQAQACVAYARALMRLHPDRGAAVEAIAGGYAVFAGVDSPITQATGIGMAGVRWTAGPPGDGVATVTSTCTGVRFAASSAPVSGTTASGGSETASGGSETTRRHHNIRTTIAHPSIVHHSDSGRQRSQHDLNRAADRRTARVRHRHRAIGVRLAFAHEVISRAAGSVQRVVRQAHHVPKEVGYCGDTSGTT